MIRKCNAGGKEVFQMLYSTFCVLDGCMKVPELALPNKTSYWKILLCAGG